MNYFCNQKNLVKAIFKKISLKRSHYIASLLVFLKSTKYYPHKSNKIQYEQYIFAIAIYISVAIGNSSDFLF